MRKILNWLPKITNQQLYTLSKLQKRAIRSIFNANIKSHTDILFDLSRITKVNNLFQSESLKMMYQFKEGLLPLAVENLIKKHTKRLVVKTRNQNLSTNYSVVGLRKGDSIYEMIQCWNNADIEIKYNSYSKRSVSQRINHFQRQSYNLECKQNNCFNCFRTNEDVYREYMKY